jgi:hypothetical protein
LCYRRFDGHFTGERPNDHRHGCTIGGLMAILQMTILQAKDTMTIAMFGLLAL